MGNCSSFYCGRPFVQHKIPEEVSPSNFERSSNNPNMLKAHVTFDEIKRILSFEKGEEVQGLRHHFIRVFSDVLSDKVAPAQVKFQRFDEHFKDYVELPNEDKLKEDIKVKAIVVLKGKYQDQGGRRSEWPCCEVSLPCLCKKRQCIPLVLLTIPVNMPSLLWNLVSKQNGAILKRHADNKVVCDGEFQGTSNDMVVKFKDASKDHYRIFFDEGKYVAVAKEVKVGEKIETQSVSSGDALGDNSEFELLHLEEGRLFTVFKIKGKDLYMGCDGSGATYLVAMTELERLVRPNPQVLFSLFDYKE